MQTIFSLLPIRQYCRVLAVSGFLLSAISPGFGQKLDEQCRDCPCLIRLAKGKAERKLYSEAIRLYNAARTCDPTQAQQIDARVAEIFQTISNLRDEAERQRRIADQALDEAEKAGVRLKNAVVRAEEETQIAKIEKARADSLAEVAFRQKDTVQQQRDSMQVLIERVINKYCSSAEKLIYELNYNAAGLLLSEALLLDYTRINAPFFPLDTPLQRRRFLDAKVRALSLEMIFFYLQTNHLDEAKPFIRFFEEFSDAKTPEQLESTIAQLDTALYAKLEARYFPKTIRIDASFSIGQTEVTFWQYALFATATKRELVQPPWGLQGDHPAVSVSWWDAVDYCTWLNAQRIKSKNIEQVYRHDNRSAARASVSNMLKKARIVWVNKHARGYRLPFNQEWLKAAQFYSTTAPSATIDSFPSQNLQPVAWNNLYSADRTHPVETTKPNGFQVYDLAGNAREWVWKNEDKTKFGIGGQLAWVSENKAKSQFSLRINPMNNPVQVLKGGSWNSTPDQCKPSSRILMETIVRMSENGFRVVLSHGRQ